jgi:large subunit ribosomal protein L23
VKKLAAHDIIQTVLVTEKSGDLNQRDQYVFKVHPKATKIAIASAVEEIFPDVQVKSVNTINYLGKPKRVGRAARSGVRPSWKKAMVTLSKGSIDVLN